MPVEQLVIEKTTMEVKSVGTFPVILLKLATPPLPPRTKLDLKQNGLKWALFLATTRLGEVGGTTGWTQSRTKKLSLGAGFYVTIAWKGFSTQSQVLLSSIVWNLFRAIKWIFRHLSLQKYRKTFSLELLKCSFLVKFFLYAAADHAICRAKELRIPCQTGVFGVDIQFTQKELSDYLNDVSWIEPLKAFNAGSTYFYYLRRCS